MRNVLKFIALVGLALTVSVTHLTAADAPIPDPSSDLQFEATQQDVADSEYEVSWQRATLLADLDAAWQAPNRAHGFRSYFTSHSIRLVPRIAEGPAWDMELALVGVGRADAMSSVESPTLHAAGTRVKYARAGILEWYENTQAGLEQGFTLAYPPASSGEIVLELSLNGTVHAELAADGQTVFLRGADGATVLHYSKLIVVDAMGQTLPARMGLLTRADSQTIQLVFDDIDATYPVTVDPVMVLPGWSTFGDQAGSWFGYSVATAGDVNGDGYSDVIIGAPAYDNGQDAEGRAFVYLGSASGLASVAAWSAESDQAGAIFGWSVASAGDVNGDGYDEVIVGASSFTNGETQEGKAFLYYGSPTGPSTTAAWTNEGDKASAAYGTSVATAGDVNGDGFADVLVSAPFYSNGQSNEGRVYLYLGSASGLDMTPDWTGEINVAGAAFGLSVATAGDVNADGFADVIIGAGDFSSPEFLEGRAYVFLGSTSGLAATPVWTAESDQSGAHFGASVAGAGDVNGDGYSDVVVGAYGYDNGENAEGRAYVFHGQAGGVAASPAWTREIDLAGVRFGISVATGGDVNGDGYADVWIGADQYVGSWGRVELYLGSSSGLQTPATLFYDGGGPGVFFGGSVATAGDVDGDGFSDLIAGGYSALSQQGIVKVYRYRGADPAPPTPAWSGEGDQVISSYGESVASAGDVNGDGYSDIIVGAPLYDNGQVDEGAAYLYLGSTAGPQTTAAWTVEGNEAGAMMGASVASAGDVNGDGYSDILVSAPGYGTGNSGRVFVYHGGPAGPSTVPSWHVDGLGRFGISVATAGDVNGDGFSDIVIGASDGALPSLLGAVYVYHGSATGLGATSAFTTSGGLSFSEFGYSVATAGDVNGDGYSDIVVGSPGYQNGQVDEGRAAVFFGSPAGVKLSGSWSIEGDVTARGFGSSVSSAGDVNGDGFSDVAIGVHFDFGAIYHGSATGLSVTPAQGFFGPLWVAPAGDVNLDGYSDLLVGLPPRVLLGSPAGLTYGYGEIPWGPGTLVWNLGSPLASAGDVNGDGLPDLIFGMNKGDADQTAEGTAFVHLGGGATVLGGLRPRQPRQLQSDGNTPIALNGKSDSESGFQLHAPGFSAAGRAEIRLQWEVKSLGASFDGTGMGSSVLTDTGTPGIAGSVAIFDEPAAGLGEGNWYHWRARTVGSNPYFPRSPWMSAVGNGMTESKLLMAGCLDSDGDGYGAHDDASCLSPAADCDDTNPASWAPPGEASNLRFTSKSRAIWDAPAVSGGLQSELEYGLIRSVVPDGLFETCVSWDIVPDGQDFEIPPPGFAFYYLSRASNGCNTQGSVGTSSDGTPRYAQSCP